jgi:hypothetical protein
MNIRKYLLLLLGQFGFIILIILFYSSIKNIPFYKYDFLSLGFTKLLFVSFIPLVAYISRDINIKVIKDKKVNTHLLTTNCERSITFKNDYFEIKDSVKGICKAIMYKNYCLVLNYEDDKGIEYITEFDISLNKKRQRVNKYSVLMIFIDQNANDMKKCIIKCCYRDENIGIDNTQNIEILNIVLEQIKNMKLIEE